MNYENGLIKLKKSKCQKRRENIKMKGIWSFKRKDGQKEKTNPKLKKLSHYQ
jgi:hypothetical protein